MPTLITSTPLPLVTRCINSTPAENRIHRDAHLGTVSIHATTAAAQPAKGAILEIPGTPYSGTVDAKGELRIADLLPGPYAVKVRDPRLSDLAFSLPTSLRFTSTRDPVVQLSLDVPTVEDFIVSECKMNRKWNTADSTYLFGRVVDGDKKPVADARVTFSVRDSAGTWSWDKETLKADADGVFESCGTTLTRGAKLQVREVRSSRHAFFAEMRYMTIAPGGVVPIVIGMRF
jgi:hypothetical protein